MGSWASCRTACRWWRSSLEGPLPEDASGADFLLLSFELARRLEELAAAVRPGGVVQALSAGVDWLLPRVPGHVVLCSARGVHDTSVSEWCAAAILAMERRLFEFRDFQREARWERSVNPASARGDASLDDIHDLDGRRVLIVGHGSIGRALERRLHPFGAVVTGVARTARAGVAASRPAAAPAARRRRRRRSSCPSPPRPSGWSTPASSGG